MVADRGVAVRLGTPVQVIVPLAGVEQNRAQPGQFEGVAFRPEFEPVADRLADDGQPVTRRLFEVTEAGNGGGEGAARGDRIDPVLRDPRQARA